MSFLDPLLAPLQYEFMVRALATTVVAAVVCALLSCWLVLVGWSLMGDAVSHAVLPGVVIAYVLGAPFALGALVFGLLAVALIGAIRDTSRVKEDAAIGIVFTTLFALGQIVGPLVVGWVADGAGGLQRGLLVSATFLLLASVLASRQKPLNAAIQIE